MVYDVVSFPVTILFIGSGIGLFYYAIKLHKKHPKEHNFVNSILTLVLWLTAGSIYPIYFSSYSPNIRFFQILSSFFICIFTPCLIILILFYQYRFVIRKNPNIKDKRTIEAFLKGFNKKDEKMYNIKSIKLKTDVHRKMLHLFPAGVVILLWVFAVYIWEGKWHANVVWGITGEEFGRFLILTAGYSGILVFGALDYIRLSFIFERHNFFHFIPDNVLNILGKSMKRRENFEYIRPTVLVLSFTPIFFFPFCIFAAAILIATIGDGAASVFGLKFGRINFPKSSEKTIIGYVSGFLTSSGIIIGMLSLFAPGLHLYKILSIAFSGGLTFFIIDVLNLRIDDNILNPIFCALVMGSLYYLI